MDASLGSFGRCQARAGTSRRVLACSDSSMTMRTRSAVALRSSQCVWRSTAPAKAARPPHDARPAKSKSCRSSTTTITPATNVASLIHDQRISSRRHRLRSCCSCVRYVRRVSRHGGAESDSMLIFPLLLSGIIHVRIPASSCLRKRLAVSARGLPPVFHSSRSLKDACQSSSSRESRWCVYSWTRLSALKWATR